MPVNQAHELCWDAIIHECLTYHLGQDGVQMSGMAYLLWNVTMQHKPTLDPGLDLVSVRHVTSYNEVEIIRIVNMSRRLGSIHLAAYVFDARKNVMTQCIQYIL